METGTWKAKTGLAQMLKGGVIMDVTSPEQAKIAQEAGACAVMALESPCGYSCPGRRSSHG
jgi:pyridoxal 5'-phosphate synthase pdxS subunit